MNDDIAIIIDANTGLPVTAILRAALPADVVVATEAVWKPFRLAVPRAEHSHWDWALKVGQLVIPGARIMGIEYQNAIEGMALVFERGHTARLQPDAGRPLVHVEILETAPWNVRLFTPTPRYNGVGMALVRASILLSLLLGYDRRIGLHSLPQSEGFYEHGCGTSAFGPDPQYHGLMYFEFTAVQAARFLQEGQT